MKEVNNKLKQTKSDPVVAVKKPRKQRKVQDPKTYVNNRELLEEIIKCKASGELSKTALDMLMKIARRANQKLFYANPNDRQDCIAVAYEDLFKYWRNFNPERSNNAFAYFTEISKKGFAKGWNKLHPKKYHGTLSLSGATDNDDGMYSI